MKLVYNWSSPISEWLGSWNEIHQKAATQMPELISDGRLEIVNLLSKSE